MYCKECQTCRDMDTKSCNTCCNFNGDASLKDNYVAKNTKPNKDNYLYKDVLLDGNPSIGMLRNIDLKINTFKGFELFDNGRIVVTGETFEGIEVKITMRTEVAEYAARNIFKTLGKRKKPKKNKVET